MPSFPVTPSEPKPLQSPISLTKQSHTSCDLSRASLLPAVDCINSVSPACTFDHKIAIFLQVILHY